MRWRYHDLVFLLAVLTAPCFFAAPIEQAPNTWVKRSPLPTTPTSPRLGCLRVPHRRQDLRLPLP